MGTSRLSVKKRILFFVIAIIFGFSLGFILSEVALRVAGPSWLRHWMVGTNLDGEIHYGSDAGWPVDSRAGKFLRFKPDTQFNVKYREYSNTVHTDQWGGRVVPSGKKIDGRPIVPILGDSFAFGLGVKDEETFINLICQNSDAVYLNLGAPGSSLPNQMDILEFRHKELGSPQLYVFVFFLGNDFTEMMRYYQESSNQDSKNSGIIDFIKARTFIQRSYAAQFILRYISDDAGLQPKYKSRFFRTADGKRLSNSIYLLMSQSRSYLVAAEKALTRSLDRLETLSKKLNFRPEFIVIPDKHQTDPYFFNKQARIFRLSPDTLDRTFPDRFLEEHLEQRGIRYLDVMSCLKDHQGLYYRYDDHLTAAGHRVVADCIHQNAESLVLPGLQIAEKK